ncbi:PEGA domain-containing protein [Candidatus Margulisiibacteriota bacterium]
MVSLCYGYSTPVFAADNTGAIKIFSETKGVKVYIDEELKGIDVIEIKNLEPGDHYVKVMKDDSVLYSELVKVTAGATSAILIKTKAPSSQQPPPDVQRSADKFFKQQQQYKQQKIDILLSKTIQTVGSSYTDSIYFPGYYSMLGSGWTTSKSTAYEVTNWKIVQGGVQEISDRQFAEMVGDKETLARMDKGWDDYNNITGWGAVWALTGIVMVLVGGSMAFGSDTVATENGAVLFAVGCLPAIIGFGMLSSNPPSGHYIQPSVAAKQAFEYNQALKKKLGLPENYEPR